ncbi:MAG: FAD-binding protein [Deltaproteobacteria bacterium]|nr:FAD-binding protein [Deltaproteobacteria bacterium]
MAWETLADEVLETDVLIVGSEGAGARAAIEAAEQGGRVTLLSKGNLGKTGATVTGDADIDVDSRSCIELWGRPGDPRDSVEAFFEDMVREGDYLNEQHLVWLHVTEAPARVKELTDWGAKIDMLTHAPGHTYPRGVWIPGTEMMRVLKKEVERRPIQVIEHVLVTDLLTHGREVIGAVGLRLTDGRFCVFRARAVILCTGGAMRIYPHTTAPQELTGDGMAMALRAGATLVDMEFPMFLPYIMIDPPSLDGVDFPYLLSAYVECHALNRQGERYMKRWDPERMERSTRDVNSVAAMVEILEGRGSPRGGTYLSLKHLPDNLIQFTAEWFPESFAHWKYGGFDMKAFIGDPTREAIETAPACHFWNGGIRINERCETTLPNLYAAGEGTGLLHGANRVSGNALTQTQVWGRRAGRFAAEHARGRPLGPIHEEQVAALRDRVFGPLERRDGMSPVELRRRVQQVAWAEAGPVRSGEGLARGLQACVEMRTQLPHLWVRSPNRVYNREWTEAIQAENMLENLEMVIRAGVLRQESRGSAYRRDFPQMDNERWLVNIDLWRERGEIRLAPTPVVVTSLTPPKGIFNYGFRV